MGTYMQYLSYVNMFIAILIYIKICFEASTKEQKVLGFISACNILMALSGCIMLLSSTSAACTVGAYLIFTGGAFIGLSFLLLISLISHMRIKRRYTILMIIVNLVFASLGLTNDSHHLMYKEMHFEVVPGQASTRFYTLGPAFYAYLVWYSLIILICVALIGHCRYRKPIVFKSLKTPLRALFAAGFLCFICFYLSTTLHTKYDYTPFSCCIGTAILLFVIYKFRAAPIRHNIEEEILNNLEDIIIASDPANKLVYANDLAKRLYDTNNSFVYGVDIHTIDEKLNELISLPVDEPLSIGNELYVCKRIEVGTKENKKGIIHWYKNVTSDRNFIAETISLKEEAEKAALAKNEFLSNVSAKLKGPVNEILAEVEGLGSKDSFDKASEKIIRNSQKLLLLSDNILDFSNAEVGKLELFNAPYEVACIAADLLKKHEAEAKARKLTLDFYEAPDLPSYLEGDILRIKQIVSNIIGEAIKDTLSGGITVCIEHEALSGEEVELKITVKDTGRGMAPEKLQERYGKVDPSEKANSNGLEVDVTQKLLEVMDGSLFIDSIPGKGTNCHIFIPQKKISSESFPSV